MIGDEELDRRVRDGLGVIGDDALGSGFADWDLQDLASAPLPASVPQDSAWLRKSAVCVGFAGLVGVGALAAVQLTDDETREAVDAIGSSADTTDSATDVPSQPTAAARGFDDGMWSVQLLPSEATAGLSAGASYLPMAGSDGQVLLLEEVSGDPRTINLRGGLLASDPDAWTPIAPQPRLTVAPYTSATAGHGRVALVGQVTTDATWEGVSGWEFYIWADTGELERSGTLPLHDSVGIGNTRVALDDSWLWVAQASFVDGNAQVGAWRVSLSDGSLEELPGLTVASGLLFEVLVHDESLVVVGSSALDDTGSMSPVQVGVWQEDIGWTSTEAPQELNGLAASAVLHEDRLVVVVLGDRSGSLSLDDLNWQLSPDGPGTDCNDAPQVGLISGTIVAIGDCAPADVFALLDEQWQPVPLANSSSPRELRHGGNPVFSGAAMIATAQSDASDRVIWRLERDG